MLPNRMDINQGKLWSLLSLLLLQSPSFYPNCLLLMPSASSQETLSFCSTFPNQYFGLSAVGYQHEDSHCSLIQPQKDTCLAPGASAEMWVEDGLARSLGDKVNPSIKQNLESLSPQFPSAVIAGLTTQPSSLIVSLEAVGLVGSCRCCQVFKRLVGHNTAHSAGAVRLPWGTRTRHSTS